MIFSGKTNIVFYNRKSNIDEYRMTKVVIVPRVNFVILTKNKSCSWMYVYMNCIYGEVCGHDILCCDVYKLAIKGDYANLIWYCMLEIKTIKLILIQEDYISSEPIKQIVKRAFTSGFRYKVVCKKIISLFQGI